MYIILAFESSMVTLWYACTACASRANKKTINIGTGSGQRPRSNGRRHDVQIKGAFAAGSLATRRKKGRKVSPRGAARPGARANSMIIKRSRGTRPISCEQRGPLPVGVIIIFDFQSILSIEISFNQMEILPSCPLHSTSGAFNRGIWLFNVHTAMAR